MTKIEPGTPIEEFDCPKCGSTITVHVGRQRGNNMVGECRGALPNGFRCDFRCTYGRNTNYFTTQEYLKSLEAENDNETDTSEEGDIEEDATQNDTEEAVNEAGSEEDTAEIGSEKDSSGATGEDAGETTSERADTGSNTTSVTDAGADTGTAAASNASADPGTRKGGTIFPI